MSESCPNCNGKFGLRQIIYGEPISPIDESKYYIGGCLISGNDPIWTCIECGWRGWSLNNEVGVRLSNWRCIICQAVGRIQFLDLDEEGNQRMQKLTFIQETTYGEGIPNAKCMKCGWEAQLIRTYSY